MCRRLRVEDEEGRAVLMQAMADPAADEKLMAELGQAGEGVDRAIASLLERGVGPVAVASALLGGALCLMSRSMGDEAVLQMLHNAAAGVSAGELRR